MTERRSVALLVAAVGGLVLGATFAGWIPRLLAPLGVTGLVLSVQGRTARESMAAGWCFGLTFMASTVSWMWPSLGVGAWLGLTAVESAWFAGLGLLTAVVGRLPGWPWWTATAWTAVEVLRTSWPWGGVPWGRLAFATPDTPWQAMLPWVGTTGTTFLLALVGSALAGVVLRARSRPAPYVLVVAAALLAAVMAGVVGPLGTTGSGSVRVAVVQGGVPGSGKLVVDHHREITADHAAETRRLVSGADWAAGPAAFVLWPENATAVDPTEDAVAEAEVESAVAAAGVPVVVGGVTDGPTSTTARNQLIAWSATGPGPRYTKQHLVPFGEYVPLRGLATRVSQRVTDIGRDMVPGPPAAPLPVAGLRLATALCFDVAYDDVVAGQVRQGADLVTVSTSNAMFLGTAQLEQQWTISRVRALETGRTVVVASINGISGAISADGTVQVVLPERDTESAIVDAEVRDGLTLAVRLGSWPGRAVIALAAAGLAVAVAGQALKSRKRPPTVNAIMATSSGS
ncbi:apolipoprotein N-acyltransferase [Nocardioides caricicola]|uniref:Apolipoprotein N-acyltransferase n=1 Tax=Nocardioides caricicola TaxID=634770 RepID=A0ABW0N4D5_9ACTN